MVKQVFGSVAFVAALVLGVADVRAQSSEGKSAAPFTFPQG